MNRAATKRVAVVTGGGSGIGLGIARHLAAGHRRVAILDIDHEAAGAVADELNGEGYEAMPAAVDVSQRASVEAAMAAVRAALGPIEILVTSAAITGFAPFAAITQEAWDRIIAVDLTGTFHCLQAALPDMVEERWGRIVTIASSAGQVGSPGQGHYSAAKGGVIAMTKTVAREYARFGITANTIPPFVVDTPMLRHARAEGQVPSAEAMASAIPSGRLGTLDDIGSVGAFLCSEAAGYITGQVIAANGGAIV
ncbi:MAG TPA: SDR family NAD(P)-dependent oxidoreductase [Acidimicrobiales bacterium]|nr:SDR family NAD(P)-dependent oxidoreductase [Acidimicrobiales bacterium]